MIAISDHEAEELIAAIDALKKEYAEGQKILLRVIATIKENIKEL